MVGWHHQTQWTWVWVGSGIWWWTGRSGMLQFMVSQRVRHNWATELNRIDSSAIVKCVCVSVCVCACVLSHVPLFATLGTAACQVPLSMKFSRQEYWSRLSFPTPPPRDLSWPRDQTCISCTSYIGRWILSPLCYLGSPAVKYKIN